MLDLVTTILGCWASDGRWGQRHYWSLWGVEVVEVFLFERIHSHPSTTHIHSPSPHVHEFTATLNVTSWLKLGNGIQPNKRPGMLHPSWVPLLFVWDLTPSRICPTALHLWPPPPMLIEESSPVIGSRSSLCVWDLTPSRICPPISSIRPPLNLSLFQYVAWLVHQAYFARPIESAQKFSCSNYCVFYLSSSRFLFPPQFPF